MEMYPVEMYPVRHVIHPVQRMMHPMLRHTLHWLRHAFRLCELTSAVCIMVAWCRT